MIGGEIGGHDRPPLCHDRALRPCLVGIGGQALDGLEVKIALDRQAVPAARWMPGLFRKGRRNVRVRKPGYLAARLSSNGSSWPAARPLPECPVLFVRGAPGRMKVDTLM
jgi:hypothetical protein